MNITTVGIDLAKNVFCVHGVDAHGKVALKLGGFLIQFAELAINLDRKETGLAHRLTVVLAEGFLDFALSDSGA